MNRGSSGGCLSWIIAVIGIVLVISGIASCSGKNKTSYSSSIRYSSRSYENLCWETGCSNPKLTGGNYCYKHTCAEPGCYNRKYEGSNYCRKHSISTTTPSKTTIRASTEKKDPYNIKDYSNIDDFYDDWYDDFDSFDDAEMYWDDHH